MYLNTFTSRHCWTVWETCLLKERGSVTLRIYFSIIIIVGQSIFCAKLARNRFSGKYYENEYSWVAPAHSEYRIACNFCGAKYSWLEVWPRIFYPRMKRPCLPLPAVPAATTKILPTKCLIIAESQIFCPPKITRYTVLLFGNKILIGENNQKWCWICLCCTRPRAASDDTIIILITYFIYNVWQGYMYSK